MKTLIIFENLVVDRVELENPTSGTRSVHYIKGGEDDKSMYVDQETGLDMKEISRVPLVEWFADNYKKHGAQLEFITDKSQEGNQFVKASCCSRGVASTKSQRLDGGGAFGVVVVVVVVVVWCCCGGGGRGGAGAGAGWCWCWCWCCGAAASLLLPLLLLPRCAGLALGRPRHSQCLGA